MSRTADILEDALRELSGVVGGMTIVTVTRRNLSGTLVEHWQRKLRAAADKLEDLK